jgi:hypothetical protein
MALGPRTESIVSEAIPSETALERENRELRAVNDILLEKVMELEDLVEELREAGKGYLETSQVSSIGSGRVPAKQRTQEENGDFELDSASLSGSHPEDRGQDERTLSVEPQVSTQPSSPWTSALPPTEPRTVPRETKLVRRLESRVPDYSPHLPPLDFTKRGKDFYEDLLDKRIIPEYDQDRFLCWCHLAKRAMRRRTGVLSLHGNSHCTTTEDEGSDVGRYVMSRWITHASQCAFYKVSFLYRRYIVTLMPLPL